MFERQGAEDWKSFLSLRAIELRAGARLVVVLPGLGDDSSSGFEPLFRHANEALAEMVTEGDRRRTVWKFWKRMNYRARDIDK